MQRWATFSKDGSYRYELGRLWDESLPCINFIMLNPSIADANIDDPTVARCMKRAEMWGFGKLLVTNIFALVSTDPKYLYLKHLDPIGNGESKGGHFRNNKALLKAWVESEIHVCAWGTHGALMNRGAEVKAMMLDLGIMPTVLKLSDDGHPYHPLYLPYSLEPRCWL